MCYTGYTLEALRARNDPWIERLLASMDILIDGPFVRDRAANLLWRGSSNQRVHFLTDTYRHLAAQVGHGPAQVEFTIGREEFLTTGTWPQGLLERLHQILRR
jgi:anaerobic ribonucleoside-triphosphate reductase activating protein